MNVFFHQLIMVLLISDQQSSCTSDNALQKAWNVILTAFNDFLLDFDEAKLQRCVEKLWYMFVLAPNTVFLAFLKLLSCDMRE